MGEINFNLKGFWLWFYLILAIVLFPFIMGYDWIIKGRKKQKIK